MKSFQYVGTDLTKVEGDAAAKLKAAGLDFVCDKVEAGVLVGAPTAEPKTWVSVPNQFHIVRADSKRVISSRTVTDSFKILQNHEAFSWIDSTSVIGDLTIVRGGTFHDGALVFLVGKYPKSTVMEDGTVIGHYALMTNGHTGTKPLTASALNIVEKTGAILHSGVDGHSIRHTSNMKVNMADVTKALASFRGLSTTFLSLANDLAKKPCTAEQAVEYFMRTIGLDADLLNAEPTKDSSRGDKSKHTRATSAAEIYGRLFLASGGSSFWNAYAAACEYITFVKATKTRSTGGSTTTVTASGQANSRVQSALYGTSSILIDRAFALAQE